MAHARFTTDRVRWREAVLDGVNIHAGSDGTARADYFTDRVTLAAGHDVGVDSDGSAIIVHAKPDTYGAEAGAGDRVACGVITRS